MTYMFRIFFSRRAHVAVPDWDRAIQNLPKKLGRGKLAQEVDGAIEYCPIGWLGHCQGISDKDLLENESHDYDAIYTHWGLKLYEEDGLYMGQIIWRDNDLAIDINRYSRAVKNLTRAKIACTRIQADA